MKVLDMRSWPVQLIHAHGSSAARSAEVASGGGEAHIHAVQIEAGGLIGPHEAGFGQLFLVVSGVGWAAGADRERRTLEAGQAAFIRRGEVHSKGADSDLLAVILQVRDLDDLPIE